VLKFYYYNVTKGITQWEEPLNMAGWSTIRDQAGKLYYYNAITNKTQWAMPDEYKLDLENKKLEQHQFETFFGQMHIV